MSTFSGSICLRRWSIISKRNFCSSFGRVTLRQVRDVYRPHSQITSGSFLWRRDVHSSIYDDQAAREFIYALHPKQRQLLFTEMQKFEEERLRAQGPDSPTVPTSSQLRLVALHAALPFIGFGFLDNFLMIMAGEYIDTVLGATLGITTMAAAGLGNLISDVAGIGSASYVEMLAARAGVKAPPMTPQQIDMKQTRRATNFGRAFGVSLGCLIGMFPLLFFRKRNDSTVEDSAQV